LLFLATRAMQRSGGAMEKQKWENIEKTYKDEWILMDEWDEDQFHSILAGHVACHSKDRDEIDEYISTKMKKIHFAIRYTGEVTGPFFIL